MSFRFARGAHPRAIDADVLRGNTATVYGIHDVRLSYVFHSCRYRLFIAAVNGADPAARCVVEQFGNTNQIEEALARLVESYYSLGLVDEAQTAAAVLGHNYPESEWYKASFALLQSKGLEPRENQGSWISRAGKKLLLGES